jgi:hypothetical protein
MSTGICCQPPLVDNRSFPGRIMIAQKETPSPSETINACSCLLKHFGQRCLTNCYPSDSASSGILLSNSSLFKSGTLCRKSNSRMGDPGCSLFADFVSRDNIQSMAVSSKFPSKFLLLVPYIFNEGAFLMVPTVISDFLATHTT